MNVRMDAKMEFVYNMENKKAMGGWIWVLIVVVLIAVGAGIYFLISGDGFSVVGGGNSIPQPPELPS